MTSDFTSLVVPRSWTFLPDHLPVPAHLIKMALLMRYARTVSDGFEVLIGGAFTSVDGQPRNGVARLNGGAYTGGGGGRFEFSAINYNVGEAAGQGVVTIVREGDLTGTVGVRITATAGTAADATTRRLEQDSGATLDLGEAASSGCCSRDAGIPDHNGQSFAGGHGNRRSVA